VKNSRDCRLEDVKNLPEREDLTNSPDIVLGYQTSEELQDERVIRVFTYKKKNKNKREIKPVL